ncbi:MAG: threonylcarbamoyl-AMP synthase [Clostridia bacterium]|nr:threonylcarbamoyl-AMP synthase [Clostridia bacterium]
MDTKILTLEEGLDKAVELIKGGDVVAFPTETVYGLGANALDKEAVKKIFLAKGRPMDNPLIIHIADKAMIDELAVDVTAQARAVIDAFMPGPITVILKKSACVPNEVSAGLSTVGIRYPSHCVAQKFIKACGLPICAPSANTSTKISPTSSSHVYEDMKGRIPLILEGGESQVGIESTIIDMSTSSPTILRPGAVTPQMLAQVLGEVKTFSGEIVVAKAPGMKYRHYAPDCEMVVASSVENAVKAYEERIDDKPVILAKSDFICAANKLRDCDHIDLGADDSEVMRNIYSAMHEAQYSYGYIICQDFGDEGVAKSVMNRIEKASGGKRV